MRKYFISTIILTASTIFTMAQDVTGVYQLQDVREMASAFEFRKDSSFSFYFVYGAVDRVAEGSYTVADGKVILKSNKEAGKDFTILKQSDSGKNFSINVIHDNNYLATTVKCIVLNAGKEEEFFADNNGLITIDLPVAEKIYLQHQLYPDVYSLIKDDNNTNHHFEVTLNPSLEQMSFKGIDFQILDDSTLTCFHNYFLPMENIRFVKQ